MYYLKLHTVVKLGGYVTSHYIFGLFVCTSLAIFPTPILFGRI